MSDTKEIKDKIDIVDLIQEYVQLKPAGVNHKGLCPFHNEKSPSFMANRERQSWHCFGCGKGGDIFSFVQEMEGMDFVESLKYLADKAGVTLTFKGGTGKSEEKARLKEVCQEAARFYHNFLLKMDQSAPAREYLKNRGLKGETIEEWRIGYVPEQWDLLTKYLLKKGHSIDDLVTAGLTIKRDGANAASSKGYYDRFRGRIMFPIRDVHGAVVGFTGRVLVETEKSGGKYVNSPQTPIFDKSRLVFGLDLAKQEIKKKNYIVMCEGQMDVIAVAQSGMKNVVATSGTAMTEHQITLLKRYSSNMAMAFDADEAGIKAAKRGIDLAIASGMRVKVIEIPEGAGGDPDECVNKDPTVWIDSVKNAKDVMQWLFNRAFSSGDISSPQGKQQIVDVLLPDIAKIPYAVEKDHWLRELAQRISVDVTVLREDMNRIAKEAPVKRQTTIDKDGMINDEEKTTNVMKERTSRLDLLVERIFVLLIRYPKHLSYIEKISPQTVENTEYIALYEALKEAYTNTASYNIEAVRATINSDSENLVDLLSMKGELLFPTLSIEESIKEFDTTVSHLNDEATKIQRASLTDALRLAEQQKDHDQVQKILSQLHAL